MKSPAQRLEYCCKWWRYMHTTEITCKLFFTDWFSFTASACYACANMYRTCLFKFPYGALTVQRGGTFSRKVQGYILHCTFTWKYTHTDTHVRACAHTYTHTHTCTHIHTHTLTLTFIHVFCPRKQKAWCTLQKEKLTYNSGPVWSTRRKLQIKAVQNFPRKDDHSLALLTQSTASRNSNRTFKHAW